MDKKNGLLSKTLVIGIFLLFVGVTIAPSINAVADRRFTKPFTNPIFDETVEITVSRYKADGTVEKTKVILSKEKALELAERFRNIDDPEKSFSLLKEYKLILDDVTRDSLRQEMLDLAEELGITEDKIKSISNRFTHKGDDGRLIGINFLNEIGGGAFFTVNLPIGLSLIIGLLNWVLYIWGIPSADLLYIAAHFAGLFLFYNGILPDFQQNIFGLFSLLGFIGYVISIPFLSFKTFITGFAVASLAIPVTMGTS